MLYSRSRKLRKLERKLEDGETIETKAQLHGDDIKPKELETTESKDPVAELPANEFVGSEMNAESDIQRFAEA